MHNMRYKFSTIQRITACICYLGILEFLLSLILSIILLIKNLGNPSRLVLPVFGGAFCSLFLLAVIYGTIRTSIMLHDVVFSEQGVFIVTKKGKILRSLEWNKIKTYTVTKESQHGGQYICLSENPDLNPLRTCFFGVVWATVYERDTIALPTDIRMMIYCDKHLNPYGIEKKYVSQKDVPKQVITLKKLNRNNIIYSALVLFLVILFAYIFSPFNPITCVMMISILLLNAAYLIDYKKITKQGNEEHNSLSFWKGFAPCLLADTIVLILVLYQFIVLQK